MIKNVNGLEEMLSMCLEGNDSDLNYCYLNEEYGDNDLIEDWGLDINKAYNELYSILSENNILDYKSEKWGEFKFELEENNIIKVYFL
jgi:hypothetical protein